MPKAKSGSKTLTDHDEIRQWAEERGANPACVRGTGGKGDVGLMRLEFPDQPGANDQKLEPIEWEEFFEKFDERGLALLVQETTAEGETSNFNKLVSRETAANAGRTAAKKSSGTKRASNGRGSSAGSSAKRASTATKTTAKRPAAKTTKKTASTKSTATTKSAQAKRASGGTKTRGAGR
jgi:hypothetical protein